MKLKDYTQVQKVTGYKLKNEVENRQVQKMYKLQTEKIKREKNEVERPHKVQK